MEEIDINLLVNNDNYLNENIPNDIIIVGKINKLYIEHKYNQLDLSDVGCKKLYYKNQKGESIKNHILPNSLNQLDCSGNELTLLPELPNSLKELRCHGNQLTLLPKLPTSLGYLSCSGNKLTILPDLPNSLGYLYCSFNKLTSFTDTQLPNSLKELYCSHNKLLSLPDFTHIDHDIELYFNQNLPISHIPYNPYLKFSKFYINTINIEGYPHNPITNQKELDKYMDYIKNYQLNRIKSARK